MEDISQTSSLTEAPQSGIQFGDVAFSSEEADEIKKLLEKKLSKEQISYRVGPGGQKVPYLESWRAIELANSIFGFSGWSSSVINLSQDYMDIDSSGKVSCGVSAVVRVQLKDGSFHEDVGYGISENQKSKGAALEKAKKEAVSDALKRALRLFGNSLGNSVYDKEHLSKVKNQPSNPPPINNSTPNVPQMNLPMNPPMNNQMRPNTQPAPFPNNGISPVGMNPMPPRMDRPQTSFPPQNQSQQFYPPNAQHMNQSFQ